MTQNEFNPYVGPRPFERQQEDSDRFFGRSQETEEIISLIFGHPVILVYAQSGAGKTSLFNASVASKLEETGFEVLPLTRVGGVVPKGVALSDIKNLYIFNALLKMDSATDPQTLLSTSLCSFLEARTGTIDENGQLRPRIIIFDQFEELFTYTPGNWREQRDGFFQQVAEALEADPLLRVVFVIREDFLAELDPYSRSLPERLRTRYRLERLGENAALRAIKDPLVNTPRKFAPGVAEGLVKELLSMRTVDATGKTAEIVGQYVEPVQLQVVCVTLWSTLEPDCIEIQKSHLEKFNVNDALSNFYKSAIEATAKETGVPEAELRNWFGKTLITPMGTRSTVFRGEDSTGGIDNRAVDFLEGQHIIRAEFRAGARWYELTHDRLVEPILANNKLWLEKNLSLLQKQTALWVAQGRPDGMLLRGKELEQAEAEAQSRTLTQDEEDFLSACNKIREREIREKRQNLFIRLLAFAAIIALIVAVGFAVSAKNQAAASKASRDVAQTALANATVAIYQANVAKDTAVGANATAASARDIVEADRLAGQSQIALGRPDTVSLGQLLAVEAYRLNPRDIEILPSVYQALYDSTEKGQDKILQDGVFSRAVFGQEANNNWLILDNTLWNLTNFQPVRLVNSDKILQTALGPDGQVVVITGDIGYSYNPSVVSVSVQDRTGRIKNQFVLNPIESGYINAVKISDDGNWIAAASYNYKPNNEIHVWNVDNPSGIQQYFYPPKSVSNIAISPDGSRVAATYGYQPLTMSIWSSTGDSVAAVAQIELSGSFTDRDRTMGGKAGDQLQFSQNGEWLAAMTDSELTIWGAAVTSPIRVPLSEGDQFTGFLFSPDSNSLVYVTKQNCYYSDNCDPNASLVRILLSKSDKPERQPIVQKSDVEITAMDISPNGRLVIGDWLGYVRAWDLDENLSNPFTAIVHAGRITSIAIGTDNDTIISSAEKDGTRLWRLSEKKPEAISVRRFPEGISNAIPAKDRSELILGGDYGLVSNSYPVISILSNLSDPKLINQLDLSAPVGSLQAVASSDKWLTAGRTLTSGAFERVRYYLDFWKLDSNNTTIFSATPLLGPVKGLAFNQGGTMLAIASTDRMWMDSVEKIQGQSGAIFSDGSTGIDTSDVKTKFAIETTNGLGDIQTLLFAQNDEYLVGAGPNGVHLWTLKNPAEYIVQGASYPIHLSPDQTWLATGSANNTLNVYQLNSIDTPIVVNTHSAVTQFAFSEDGKWLAVAVASGKVLIYQFPVTDSSEPYYYFQGPRDTTWLEFSPQWPREKWLVASSGYSAFLWDLNKLNENNRTTNDNPVTLWGHRGNLLYAGFVGDGKWIITAATDQTVRFWSTNPEDLVDAACVYAGRNLTPTEWNAYLEGTLHQTCEGFDFAVPEASPTPTVGPTQSSATQIAPFATSTQLPTPSVSFTTYTVKQGDTLGGIAIKFGISLDTLVSDNGININDFISVGQTLKIRVVKTP